MIIYTKAPKIAIVHQPGNNGQPSPGKYEQGVVDILDQIIKRPAGAVLINAIQARGVGLAIVPYDPTVLGGDKCNSWTGSDNLSASVLKWAPVVQQDGTFLIVAGKVVMGTGTGSPSTVGFNPDTFAVSSPCFTGPGSRKDEILFHEMTHALRKMAGVVIKGGPFLPNPKMDNFEEFVAVTATNIYRSEMFDTLRRDHSGFEQLGQDLSGDHAYFDHYKQAFNTWVATQRDFCVALAGLKVAFNPVRVAVTGH